MYSYYLTDINIGASVMRDSGDFCSLLQATGVITGATLKPDTHQYESEN